MTLNLLDPENLVYTSTSLNHRRANAIKGGRFTFLGPEGRVIQPRDWKAIKPNSLVEIAFNDPKLERKKFEKVDDAYINPNLEKNVSDRRLSSTERMLSRLGIRH